MIISVESKTIVGDTILKKIAAEKQSLSSKVFVATKTLVKEYPVTIEINNKLMSRSLKLQGLNPKLCCENEEYVQSVRDETIKKLLSKYGGEEQDFIIGVRP